MLFRICLYCLLMFMCKILDYDVCIELLGFRLWTCSTLLYNARLLYKMVVPISPALYENFLYYTSSPTLSIVRLKNFCKSSEKCCLIEFLIFIPSFLMTLNTFFVCSSYPIKNLLPIFPCIYFICRNSLYILDINTFSYMTCKFFLFVYILSFSLCIFW